jgi:hypothetical protein
MREWLEVIWTAILVATVCYGGFYLIERGLAWIHNRFE